MAPLIESQGGKVAIHLPTVRAFVSKRKRLESAVDTTGYEIRFTTDGCEPIRQSALYTGSLDMISGAVRARRFLEEKGAWQVICERERLDNIVNDPTCRERLFCDVRGRFVKFVPLRSENERCNVTAENISVYTDR